jgi:copper chaperone CopZ
LGFRVLNSHMEQTITFKISGLHCTSCVMNIDGALEDSAGVKSSSTNFAKSETRVVFDAEQISPDSLILAIKALGYEASSG